TAVDLDPRRPETLIFWHTDRKLIGRLEVKEGDKGPVTAKLQRWGTLKGRVLDGDGKPLSGANVSVQYLNNEKQPVPAFGVLPHFNQTLTHTDAEGRFRIDGFLPGMTYELTIMYIPGGRPVPPARVTHSLKDLGWKPGEAKDVGDVKLKVER